MIMVKSLDYKSTGEIELPKKLISQVLGQDDAVNLIKKVAKRRRHLLLVGHPGTGKSMIGQALSELLSKEKLVDIISLTNPKDENVPLIRTVPKGQGSRMVMISKLKSKSGFRGQNILFFILVLLAVISPWWIREVYGDIMAAASLIGSMVFLSAFILFINLNKRMKLNDDGHPKLLVDNYKVKRAPFIEATGAHAGALLGDVLHDPLQSGGFGTPAYQRVVPGMIHRANGGVLFIDEIATLHPKTQQELLTALQEKKYSITGQSDRSSGAMVRTEPVPTDFVLVAAGNLETVKHMHPALRSRIRGYGYEIYMHDVMNDNIENRNNLVRFVAQEVKKDGHIPHFSKRAVGEIIEECRRRSDRRGKLSVRLRDIGGLIRAAGDVASSEGAKLVEIKHVIKAKILARTLEKQIADKYISYKKDYQVIRTTGKMVGRVNGLAVIGGDSTYSGIVLPLESEVTPGGKKAEIIATGKLGTIAKEAVQNVSAIIMKYFGEDIKEKYDIYVQFLQTSDSGVEGDSASVAVAVSILSALKDVPVRQDTAMTGSLSVRGEVLVVGGVNAKIEAAVDAGIKRVIIPKANFKDILISNDLKKKVKIIPAENLGDVLKEALDWKGKEKLLKKIIG